MEKRELRTKFAIQALDLAQAFDSVLGIIRVGPHDYAPNLTAPDGPSTGGGKQALQHLRLVPKQEGAATLVVGSANQVTRTAELRTFEHIDAVHRQRFKTPVELDRAEYMKFLEQARSFFSELNFSISMTRLPGLTPASGTPVSTGQASGVGLIVGFLLGSLLMGILAAAVVWMLMHRH